MNHTIENPLLAVRPPQDGYYAYVYQVADLDEIVREVWAAAGHDDMQAINEIMKGRLGPQFQSQWTDAILRYKNTAAPPSPTTTTIEPAPESRARSSKSWCRHCDGPVSDDSGDCGECR